MGRNCKCAICKSQLNTDTAYKTSEKNRNKYYCTKEEYERSQLDIKQKGECCEIIIEILNIPFITPMLHKEINELHKFYSYKVISKTFQETEKSIKWFLDNNSNSSEYGKVRYIIAVIKNNINTIDKKQKQIEEENKKDIPKVDVDIINIDTVASVDISDISKWLD